MLQTIREKSQGPVLTFIVVAICMAFAATGVDSILGSGSVGRVATVNGEKVTTQELNEAIYLQKRELIARMGENIDPSMLDEKKLKAPALESLIQRKILLQVADENNMLISDSEISKMITQNPDFKKDGKFSYDYFQTLLTNAGLTPALYKRLLVSDVLIQQVSSGIIETGFITDKDIALDARFTHQTRDISYATLKFDKEKDATIASEEEVKSYYDNNPDQFQSDESVIVDYLELNQSDFKADISEDEIKSVYNQEVASFKGGEQREVSHILINVDADTSKEKATAILEGIKQKLKAGEDFADVARTYSEDLASKEAGGYLGILDEASYPKEFVVAAKALKVGGYSDIVSAESGLHLIKLSNINIPKMPAYEERKNAIQNDLQMAKSAPLFVQAVDQLKDLAFNTADLSESAQTLNKEIKTSPIITRQGGEGLFSNRLLYKAAFKDNVLNNNENSEVIEISPTQVIVLHLKEHHKSALIPFAEAHDKAKLAVINMKAIQQLNQKAETLKNLVSAGNNIDAIAKQNGYEFKSALASKRSNPDIDNEVLGIAFKLPRASHNQPIVEKSQKNNGDYLVVTVSNIKDGEEKDITDMESKTLKTYLARMEASMDFKALEESLKTKSDVNIVD